MCMTRLVIAGDRLGKFRQRGAMTKGTPLGAIAGSITEESRKSERAG